MANAWQINHFGDADIEILDDEKAVCVIEARWEDGKLVDDEGELTARAKLIAAAPELLASLIDCRDWLVAIIDSSALSEESRAILARATEAIEKAGGK